MLWTLNNTSMTVAELKAKLNEMPDGCHVYIQTEEFGECFLVKSCDYADSLGDIGEDDSDQTDGVVIGSNSEVWINKD